MSKYFIKYTYKQVSIFKDETIYQASDIIELNDIDLSIIKIKSTIEKEANENQKTFLIKFTICVLNILALNKL